MNPFMPDRGEIVESRHIPYPPQGNSLISSQGTPPDFTDADFDPMKAVTWTNDPQPTHHIPVPWNPVDATERLSTNPMDIDFLTGDPGLENFRPGPGDKDNGPGWM